MNAVRNLSRATEVTAIISLMKKEGNRNKCVSEHIVGKLDSRKGHVYAASLNDFFSITFKKLNYGISVIEFRIVDGEIQRTKKETEFVTFNPINALLSKRNIRKYLIVEQTENLVLIQVVNTWMTKCEKYIVVLF